MVEYLICASASATPTTAACSWFLPRCGAALEIAHAAFVMMINVRSNWPVLAALMRK
jgi:hypothetical protein